MCFIDNNRLQNDMQTVAEVCDQQHWELRDINRSRSDDVAKLSYDAVIVKELMREPEDALLFGCGCHGNINARFGGSAHSEEHRRLQGILDRRHSLIEDLQNRVEAQKASLFKARDRVEDEQLEAATQGAKLKLLTEMHQQEVQQLRRHLSQGAFGEATGKGASNGLGEPLGMLPLTVVSARQRLVLSGKLRAEEAQKLSETERRLHHEEIEAIWLDIKATSEAIAARGGLTPDASASAVRRAASGRQEVLRHCEQLRRPANSLLATLKQPALPQVPPSVGELGAWLQLSGDALDGSTSR
jgi:hypothetical protein